ncbi:hypothetical protein HPB51_019569 [Rhipicephalus microplus]|uniref:Uncharacterized protein n=1 Tax=Rhipicephalus microplus TaxID=6941 RepID=A0A9J6DWQ8_RHIMP|nr:hypothetical protein HPB51_019569 [Rhipicephalus microplus]
MVEVCADSCLHWLHSQTNDPEKVKKGKDGKLKDADGRTAVMQANGIMHNGIDDDKVYNPVGYRGGGGSRQASPSEDKGDKLSKAPLEALVMGPGSSGPPLEAHFDHHTMDLSSFDYPPHGLLPTSMESPGMLDYTSQYSLGQGQQQGGALGVPPPAAPTPSPFAPPSTPYLLNQDPYGAPPHPLGIVTG